MISWEAYMDIIALHQQGLSQREITKRTGRHRKTVKKYIQNGQTPGYHKAQRRESILAPYYPVINDFLEEDDYRATWIYQRLKQLGYAGGYDTVKIYVRRRKRKRKRQAYIRFETIPGLQGQMDWADFKVADFKGGSFTVYLFILVLGFSRAMFAMFVDRCTLQAFMDAHIAAFHYLGGIPMEMLYDNMKHVVISRTGGQTIFQCRVHALHPALWFQASGLHALQPLGERQGGTPGGLHSRVVLARLFLYRHRAGEPGSSQLA